VASSNSNEGLGRHRALQSQRHGPKDVASLPIGVRHCPTARYCNPVLAAPSAAAAALNSIPLGLRHDAALLSSTDLGFGPDPLLAIELPGRRHICPHMFTTSLSIGEGQQVVPILGTWHGPRMVVERFRPWPAQSLIVGPSSVTTEVRFPASTRELSTVAPVRRSRPAPSYHLSSIHCLLPPGSPFSSASMPRFPPDVHHATGDGWPGERRAGEVRKVRDVQTQKGRLFHV